MSILVRLLLGLLLLAVPAYVYFLFNRSSLLRLSVAVVRMLLQLTVLGACLWAVWRVDSPWLTVLWLLVMSVVVAVATCLRAQLSMRLLPWMTAGVVGGVLLPLCYLLLVVLRPEQPMSARWIVPLAGVLLAHVLTTNVCALSAFYRKLLHDQPHYEELLGNGLSRRRALAPFVGEALLAMARPAVANLSVTGLLAMPLLLSGQLLAGAGPVEAVLLTVQLIVAAFTSAVITLLLVLWITDRQAFDRRGNLRNVVRPSSPKEAPKAEKDAESVTSQ